MNSTSVTAYYGSASLLEYRSASRGLTDRGGWQRTSGAPSPSHPPRHSRHPIPCSSTKGAIVAFTRSLSLQLAPKGIRVNAVAPGPVRATLPGVVCARALAVKAGEVKEHIVSGSWHTCFPKNSPAEIFTINCPPISRMADHHAAKPCHPRARQPRWLVQQDPCAGTPGSGGNVRKGSALGVHYSVRFLRNLVALPVTKSSMLMHHPLQTLHPLPTSPPRWGLHMSTWRQMCAGGGGEESCPALPCGCVLTVPPVSPLQDSSYMSGQVLHPNGGTIVNG